MRTCVCAILVVLTLAVVASDPSDALFETIMRPRLLQKGVPSELPVDLREAVQWLYDNHFSNLMDPGSGALELEAKHAYALEVLQKAGEEASPAVGLLVPMLGDAGILAAGVICPGHSRGVAGILGAMGELPLDPLLALLKDPDAKIRASAAQACQWTTDPRAVEPLLAALKDPDAKVRSYAGIALGHLQDARVVARLISALKDQDEVGRRGAVIGLGESGDERALPPLTAALKDQAPRVRVQAVQALGWFAGVESIPALAEALKDRDASVRSAAAETLEYGVDHRVRVVRVSAPVRRSVSDPRALDALIEALKDRDVSVRKAAAGSLYTTTDPRAVGALIAALKDRDSSVRRTAAAALTETTDPLAIEALIASFRDRDPLVKSQAAKSLQHSAEPRAVEALIAALRDRECALRVRAAEALEGAEAPHVLEALTGALQDSHLAVRAQAALSLGRGDDPETIKALAKAVAEEVATEAQLAELRQDMGELGRLRITGALGSTYIMTTLLTRPAAVTPLISLVGDPDCDRAVRTVAASALGELKDPGAVEALIEALGKGGSKWNPPAWSVKLGLLKREILRKYERLDVAAALALGRIGDSRAVEPLIASLQGGDYRMKGCAAQALGEIKDRRAVGPLIAAMQHRDWYVQAQAARALRAITGEGLSAFEPEKWQQWWDQHKAEYEQ